MAAMAGSAARTFRLCAKEVSEYLERGAKGSGRFSTILAIPSWASSNMGRIASRAIIMECTKYFMEVLF